MTRYRRTTVFRSVIVFLVFAAYGLGIAAFIASDMSLSDKLGSIAGITGGLALLGMFFLPFVD